MYCHVPVFLSKGILHVCCVCVWLIIVIAVRYAARDVSGLDLQIQSAVENWDTTQPDR